MKPRRLTYRLLAAASLACAGTNVQAQAPTCNQSPTPDCLYAPAITYTVPTQPEIVETAYKDSGGMLRRVKFAIRRPANASPPLPVVIWSHGGPYGRSEPDDVMQEWSRATTTAGYATVTIAHPSRNDASLQLLCASSPLELDEATCDVFKHLMWDRPYDITAVINELERLNSAGDFQGQFDLAHIAVGGHSAGAGGAMTVAGALRNFTGKVLEMGDSRPVAFLAFSPQSPGSEGFFDTDFRRPEHSWLNIGRPTLMATGDGDATCIHLDEPGSCFGDSPYLRRIGYERMPAGNKYQLYIHDPDAFHTLFDLNTGDCASGAKPVDPAKCDEIARWLTSTAVAFLDGHMRQDPLALQWLSSRNIVNASGGVAEWRSK